jgi:hypothetical protein
LYGRAQHCRRTPFQRDRILLLNDDARPMGDVLMKCDTLLASDRAIGCVGWRAIERGPG